MMSIDQIGGYPVASSRPKSRTVRYYTFGSFKWVWLDSKLGCASANYALPLEPSHQSHLHDYYKIRSMLGNSLTEELNLRRYRAIMNLASAFDSDTSFDGNKAFSQIELSLGRLRYSNSFELSDLPIS